MTTDQAQAQAQAQAQTHANLLKLLRAASLLIAYCNANNIAIRHGSVDYLAALNEAVESAEGDVDQEPWITEQDMLKDMLSRKVGNTPEGE